MKNIQIFFSIFLLIFIVSCKKDLEDSQTTVYNLQLVPTGEHYCSTCNHTTMVSFVGAEYLAYIKLDTSLLVHGEAAFQSKLCGFFEDNVHDNSARVSYQTITGDISLHDSLRLKTYTYNNGIRNINENFTIKKFSRSEIEAMLQHNDSIRVSIKVAPTSYVFQINDDPPVITTRTATSSVGDKKYLDNHYYGGDPVAPHDMKIWIMFDSKMLE